MATTIDDCRVTPDSRADARWSPGKAAVAWSVVGIIMFAASRHALSFPLNHDVSWHMHIAQTMLGHAELHQPPVEVNPPLATLLVMPALAVAELTGIGLTLAFQLGTLALAAAVIGVAVALVRSGPAPRSLGPYLAGSLVLAGIWMPGVDFGQREHLLFWLVIPLALVGYLRIVGREPSPWLAVSSGLVAGVGIALKPHFLAMWVALEVLVVLRVRGGSKWQRIRRPETATVLVVLLLYWTGVLVFTNWLPTVRLVGSIYESFFGVDRLALVWSPGTFAIALCAVALVRGSGPVAGLALVFTTLAAGCWLAFVSQGKGWTYHYYPVWALIVVAALLIAYDYARAAVATGPDRNRLPIVVLTTIMAATLVRAVTIAHLDWRDELESNVADLTAYFEETPARTSVLMLSDLVVDGFPLVHLADLDWVSPFPSSWFLQAMYGASPGAVPVRDIRSPSEMSAVESEFFSMLASAVTESRPEYILADTSRTARFNGAPFPYLDYLRQDPRVRVELSRYEPAPQVGKFAVLRRHDAGAATRRRVSTRRGHDAP